MQDLSEPHTSIDGPKLPRSLRWRVQLGVLKVPARGDVAWLDRLHSVNALRMRESRERYDRLVEKYDKDRFWSLSGDSIADVGDAETFGADLDPLSMLVKQEEAREKQEELEREVGKAVSMQEINMSNDIVSVVKKDLNRLPDYHASYFSSRSNWKHHTIHEGTETDFETAQKDRNECITQMLHVYGREHPKAGYQQGMHEIFSYAMFVVEMDLFDIETSACDDFTGLISSGHLLHDSFTLAEAILNQMLRAFGVSDDENVEPLEMMGASILHKIQYVARDKDLYTYFQTTKCCLSLYTARWVRLLFAREVCGWRNVLLIWDIFFDCITANKEITSMNPIKYTRPGVLPELELGVFDLMVVLEMAAASLIWMHRDSFVGNHADDDLQMLTTMKPLVEVGPLISTLLSSLRRLQTSSNMAPLLHPHEKEVMKIQRQSSQKTLLNPRHALTRMMSVPDSISMRSTSLFGQQQQLKATESFLGQSVESQFGTVTALMTSFDGVSTAVVSKCNSIARSRSVASAHSSNSSIAVTSFQDDDVVPNNLSASHLEDDIMAIEALAVQQNSTTSAYLMTLTMSQLSSSDLFGESLDNLRDSADALQWTPVSASTRGSSSSSSELSQVAELEARHDGDNASPHPPSMDVALIPLPSGNMSGYLRETIGLLPSNVASDLQEGKYNGCNEISSHLMDLESSPSPIPFRSVQRTRSMALLLSSTLDSSEGQLFEL